VSEPLVERAGFAGKTVERAILCANSHIHFGDVYLKNDDPERVRIVADKCADQPWCGGAPHFLALREHIITEWRPVIETKA
jgi:hypothetical protein